jgi:hypothetical protein
MLEEMEFEFPSIQFFEKIEICASELPIANVKKVLEFFKKLGTTSTTQNLSDLVVRLKIEISKDFAKHEAEANDMPYLASYLVVFEDEDFSKSLQVRTALKSRHGLPGRVLYGTNIFRIEENQFISESSYET